MYNDILRIRNMCVATMLSRNGGVVLPTLLLRRKSARYTRCQATLVIRPWRTVTNSKANLIKNFLNNYKDNEKNNNKR